MLTYQKCLFSEVRSIAGDNDLVRDTALAIFTRQTIDATVPRA